MLSCGAGFPARAPVPLCTSSPVILSRRSAAKDLRIRGSCHMRRILRSFAVTFASLSAGFAAQDDGSWEDVRSRRAPHGKVRSLPARRIALVQLLLQRRPRVIELDALLVGEADDD